VHAASSPTSHDIHGHVSGIGETVAIHLRCVGRRGDRGKADGMAGLAPNGLVGKLPPSTDVCCLNGLAAGKSPNWRLAKLNSRRGEDGG
jgi:hypothetical protein